MIGTERGIEVPGLGAAVEGVPVVWVEASASFLGHPERPITRTIRGEARARAIFSDPGALPPDPGLWTLPGLPRPVDGYGSRKRFHSRPPSAWESPVRLAIPTAPWKTPKSTAFPTSAHRPCGCCARSRAKSRSNSKTQEPGQKLGSGLPSLNYVSTETG